MEFDRVAHGDMIAWAIGQLRTRLSVMMEHAGGADVAAGGQGAPLAPYYHLALASELHGPLAILNIGGVASHLATIAREYRVPTIVGQPGATQLEAGRLVTVDATSATIFDYAATLMLIPAIRYR